jgi:ABC-type polysaccharide/polyol phosphate export permease
MKRDIRQQYKNLAWLAVLLLFFLSGVLFVGPALANLLSIGNYLSFVSIGILVLGIYNTSYFYMNVISGEIRRGYTKYLLVLPLSRAGLALARLATGALMGVTFASILIVFVVFIAGLPSYLGFLLVSFAIVLVALFLAGLGVSIAIFFKPEIADPISDIIGLLFTFTSTLYYPESLMPTPVRLISMVNPFSAGCNIIRAGLGQQIFHWSDALVLIICAALFSSLSIIGYYRKLATP